MSSVPNDAKCHILLELKRVNSVARITLAACARNACLGGLLLGLATFTSAVAGTIAVGAPADTGAGSCVPFDCNGPNEQFQQLYMNTLLSGPITITGLQFFNTQFNTTTTTIDTGTFTVSLSTTTAAWNTLSTTQANNIGGDSTQVFSGSLVQPWAFGDTLSIPFSTPFTYTPGSSANLLVDIGVTGLGDRGIGEIFFDINGLNGGNFNGNTIFGQAYNGGTFGPGVHSGFGLVTGFETTSAVPEPMTISLVASGLAGISAMRRRKRT